MLLLTGLGLVLDLSLPNQVIDCQIEPLLIKELAVRFLIQDTIGFVAKAFQLLGQVARANVGTPNDRFVYVIPAHI